MGREFDEVGDARVLNLSDLLEAHLELGPRARGRCPGGVEVGRGFRVEPLHGLAVLIRAEPVA
eukprot:9277420-Alexandrium_andersonii.AAC.1